MTITLRIDDSEVQVRDGATVLDAINASGTYISQLCKDPDMEAIGACRTCLVEVEGMRGLPASCSVPAADGMNVWTGTDKAREVRTTVLELTSAMVGANGNGENGHRELTVAAREHGLDAPRWASREREPVDSSNPVFDIAMDSCILCGRCAQACQQGHQFIGAIDFLGTGRTGRIGTFMDRPLVESVCTTCGQCLSVCPTGAIEVKAPPQEAVKTVTTTCPYCGVGCGIKAGVDETDRIIEMLDDPDNQSSLGMLCVKGRFGYTFVHHEDRLTTPLVRREGQLVPVSWDEALDYVAERLAGYSGDEFATLCSAKATNEDGYVQQKFARVVMQSNHIDHCTRLCHSPSVEAMLTSLGSGATSNSYIDYEEAGCLVIIGSDANSNHPVAAARMRRAVIERGAKLIVINPRRIEMCDFAELWLRPRPGTDVALLNAMAKVLLDEGLYDEGFVRDRTEGFDEWRSVVDKYDLDYASGITGVPAEDIAKAARIYANPPFSGSCLIWGMGITQHTNGTANAHGLLNLALAAGQLGRPGCGISPLRGQNNVQGCGDAGCLPNSFPGYQVISDDTVAKFQDAWDCTLPAQKGMVVTEMVEAMTEGRLKAMYVTGENPLLSEPDLHHAEKAFKSLDFLVVQDIFMHETAEIADVVLPATTFAEKDGTFTNSERRVQRVRKAVEPIGGSRPDWDIICDLAQRLSRRRGLDAEGEFSYRPPVGDMGRDGGAHAQPVGHLVRAAGGRRDPVALPYSRSPGHAVPVREGLPARPAGQVRRVRPGPSRGGAAQQAFPAHPQHGPHPLPLARRDDHAARRRPAGEVAGAPGRHERGGRGEVRRAGRRVDQAALTPRQPGGPRALHGEDAGRRGLRPLRQAPRPRRQLPHQLGLRPQLQDPRVQSLRRPHRKGNGTH